MMVSKHREHIKTSAKIKLEKIERSVQHPGDLKTLQRVGGWGQNEWLQKLTKSFPPKIF